MHKTDAARLERQIPKMTKSHQCKVNGDFMQENLSNELDSHANFNMLNVKKCNADFYCFLTKCQHSIFVNKIKKKFCSLVSTNVKMTLKKAD